MSTGGTRISGGTLKGRVTMITGAAAGIGRASAVLFATEGAQVVLSDIDASRGERVAQEIRKSGGNATFFRADVSVPEDVRALVEHAVKTYGELHCAFNNAGIEGTMASTGECTEENWDQTLGVNLKGVWLCMRYELAQMLKQGHGVIVNMSSVAGMIGFPGLPAYVASKHAVIGLTKTAALEYAQYGIRVNAVCPGVIHTEMIDRITGKKTEVEGEFIAYEPIGRMGTPEEVAEAALWLCADSSSFVTGHTLVVDGGFLAR